MKFLILVCLFWLTSCELGQVSDDTDFRPFQTSDLKEAIIQDDPEAVVEIAQALDIKTSNDFQSRYILHFAVRNRSYQSIRALVDNLGLDVNKKNLLNQRPLDLAYEGWNDEKIIKYLEDKKAKESDICLSMLGCFDF